MQQCYTDKFLPESDIELGFVSLTVPFVSESPTNSSSMKDSLKYLIRSFCREFYHNTSETCYQPIMVKTDHPQI